MVGDFRRRRTVQSYQAFLEPDIGLAEGIRDSAPGIVHNHADLDFAASFNNASQAIFLREVYLEAPDLHPMITRKLPA